MTNVLLTSIGRRTYLAHYFAAAFGDGSVLVADADGAAPGMHVGYRSVVLPGITEANYVQAMNDAVRTHDIGMIVSLHDREVAHLARCRDALDAGCTVLGMPTEHWNIGLDKVATQTLLEDAGIAVPRTATSIDMARGLIQQGEISFPLVMKPRFGSASVGVEIVHQMPDLVTRWTGSRGEPWLLQQYVEGQEFGFDIVCDLEGRYIGALARRKLRMANGETDDAVTVDSAPFERLAERIAATTRHSGLIDVDVMVDDAGEAIVIDVNPRFGGGYPFSHVAGADVPALLRDLLAREEPHGRMTYSEGVRSRKTINVVVVSHT